MGAVRPYLQFARLAFQRRAAYRLANFTGVAVNFFFLLVHAQVLLAFFRARGDAAGWQPNDAVLYFAASESLLLVIGIFPDYRYNLAERVRSGEIVSDLVRPVGLYWRELAERFGTGGHYLVTRAPAVFLGGWLVYGLLPPLRPELALFPVSLALALAVSAGLWFIACSSAFFRESAAGELSAIVFINTFLGGVFVPIDFYPPVMRWIADAAAVPGHPLHAGRDLRGEALGRRARLRARAPGRVGGRAGRASRSGSSRAGSAGSRRRGASGGSGRRARARLRPPLHAARLGRPALAHAIPRHVRAAQPDRLRRGHR